MLKSAMLDDGEGNDKDARIRVRFSQYAVPGVRRRNDAIYEQRLRRHSTDEAPVLSAGRQSQPYPLDVENCRSLRLVQ